MEETQKKVAEFIKKFDEATGYNHDLENTIIHIFEELGELVKYIRREDKAGIEQEIADITLLIFHLANLYDINVKKAVNRRILAVKERHGI